MRKILVLIVILSLYNCSLGKDDVSSEKTLDIRFIIETKNKQQTSANIFLEGSDGNLVTGSTVIIINSENVATLAGFDFTKGCYSNYIPSTLNGEYSIEVISSLLDKKRVQKVEHFILLEAPLINQLADSEGNRALTGDTLNISEEINLSWDLVKESTIYQIRILKNGKDIYTGSSKDNSIIIPGNTLKEEGQFSVYITAQYISGDPIFEKSNYYSYSEKIGSTLIFNGILN